MSKLTEYQCFKDYNSYKLKNSIRITKKQKEKHAALKEKCNLLPPKMSYFVPYNHISVHLQYAFIAAFLVMILIDVIIINYIISYISSIIMLLLILTIPIQYIASMPLFYKSAMKKIKQIEETIAQFETSLAEDVEDSDLKQIERFLAPESTTYGKLTESIIKNLKQEQQYWFKSFSIEDICLGNKKNHLILVGTNAGESKDKMGNVYERQWKRRYTIIHKKGLVRISDTEEMQMQ